MTTWHSLSRSVARPKVSRRPPATASRAEKSLMALLARHWRGPAVSVEVEQRRYQLGSGNAVAEVLLSSADLIPRLVSAPELAFGEAYMRGEIEVRGSLQGFLQSYFLTKPDALAPWPARCAAWLRHWPRSLSVRRSLANARFHYDIGNDFYRLWLDPTLTYSCAYYLQDSDDLATAQQQKLELLCRKVRLQPGHRLLDIGCGWGGLLLHAVQHHGVQAVGVTPASEQADYIEALARQAGVADRLRVERKGWRAIEGTFDRIISVGMFEHVGLKQYRAFFNHWAALLAPAGLSLLHCIGRMQPMQFDPWIDKYIFPDGYLPTLAQISSLAATAKMCIVDVENLRQHYARTLQHWSQNFQAARDRIVEARGEAFARMWSLYLNGSAAAFRWGDLQLWQTVMAKDTQSEWPLNREVTAGLTARLAQ